MLAIEGPPGLSWPRRKVQFIVAQNGVALGRQGSAQLGGTGGPEVGRTLADAMGRLVSLVRRPSQAGHAPIGWSGFRETRLSRWRCISLPRGPRGRSRDRGESWNRRKTSTPQRTVLLLWRRRSRSCSSSTPHPGANAPRGVLQGGVGRKGSWIPSLACFLAADRMKAARLRGWLAGPRCGLPGVGVSGRAKWLESAVDRAAEDHKHWRGVRERWRLVMGLWWGAMANP